MGLDKWVRLVNCMGFDPIKFQIQISNLSLETLAMTFMELAAPIWLGDFYQKIYPTIGSQILG